MNGKPYGVKFSQEKYDTMKQIAEKAATVESVEELNALIAEFEPLTKESYKEIVEHKSPYLFVNEASGKFYLKVGTGDNAKVSKHPIPQGLVDRIVKSVELGIDVAPLVKAVGRFLRNPNFNPQKFTRFVNYINQQYTDRALRDKLMTEEGVSYEVATERATTYQTPITNEGLICTYKVSAEVIKKYALDKDGNKIQVDRYGKTINEDTGEISTSKPEFVEDRIFQPAVMGTGGDAFYCGDSKGHFIKVGQRHRLESWEQVDCNDSRSCVKGLHTGNLDYIRGYQAPGTETHNVFVDPMFIGAITDDGSGALRVLEYFVHSSFAGVNKSIYHSSKYAAVTDAAYQEMFEKAIEASNKKAAELKEDDDQKAALVEL